MDRPPLGDRDVAQLVDGLADDVDDPAQRGLADRDGDRSSGVLRPHPWDHPVRGLHRDRADAVLAECERQGLAFLPFFPLASGLLTGKYRKGEPGPEGARLIVESHGAAINRIQQIINLEDIDCDFERLDGYLMSREPGQRDELEREAEAAERAGLADVTLVERAPIAGFESGTALRFPGQGQFHILKYLSGVARAIGVRAARSRAP